MHCLSSECASSVPPRAQVVVAKMQEITLFEWLPALGISPQEVFHWAPLQPHLAATAALSTEFFLTYRWGHTAVPDVVAGFELSRLFDGEAFFHVTSAAGAADAAKANADLDTLVQATSDHPMAALDGRMSDALRNVLFGSQGLDLGAFNIFRARDVGVRGYAALARCYGVRADPHVRAVFCPLPRLPRTSTASTRVRCSRTRARLCRPHNRVHASACSMF